jgi:DNA-directed RNA polymerase subunit RPC12/RpoP
MTLTDESVTVWMPFNGESNSRFLNAVARQEGTWIPRKGWRYDSVTYMWLFKTLDALGYVVTLHDHTVYVCHRCAARVSAFLDGEWSDEDGRICKDCFLETWNSGEMCEACMEDGRLARATINFGPLFGDVCEYCAGVVTS